MKIVVHKVGNKINGESLILSQEQLAIDEQTAEVLQNYFLGSFTGDETYQFYSDAYLENNVVFKKVSEMFEGCSLQTRFLVEPFFIQKSGEIAQHLFDVAENPRVQGGELFVVYFKDESEAEEKIDQIGIFKTEKLQSFLKIHHDDSSAGIETDAGISLLKIDKAVLIHNKDKESGFVLQVVDNNKNGDMYYWFEDFLKVRQREDDYFHTQESLMIYRDYIQKQLPQEFEASKLDQVAFMQKSLEYFKEKEEFNIDEFNSEVFADTEVIESFNNFKTDYEQEMQLNVSEKFPVSDSAVKKMQRLFKGKIKLDKNFEINVLGDRKMIESGSDEKGKFYKFYFDKES